MEGKRYQFIVLLLLLTVVSFAQSSVKLYEAYVQGDMDLWRQTILQMEAEDSDIFDDNLTLIDAYYGYIAWCIDQKRIAEAKSYLRKARKLTDHLASNNYRLDLLQAYRSAYVGFDIGFAPYKAPFIGPNSLKFAQDAVAKNKRSALGHIQLGNIAFYTPKMFGGSKEDALAHFIKAEQWMEVAGNYVKDWKYLSLQVNIIQTYLSLNRKSLAEDRYEKLLRIEPQLRWVEKEIGKEFIN